jgi:hypothetical protein
VELFTWGTLDLRPVPVSHAFQLIQVAATARYGDYRGNGVAFIVSPANRPWVLQRVGKAYENLLEVPSQREFPLARSNPEEI